jgi:hypothetical protein
MLSANLFLAGANKWYMVANNTTNSQLFDRQVLNKQRYHGQHQPTQFRYSRQGEHQQHTSLLFVKDQASNTDARSAFSTTHHLTKATQSSHAKRLCFCG